jgi:type VI protein secretion system component VasF
MSRAHDEERLGALLRILRPAPRGWIQAAQELPGARESLDEIVARAQADLEFRAALVADLEAALEQAGYEPDRRTLSWLEERLAQPNDPA